MDVRSKSAGAGLALIFIMGAIITVFGTIRFAYEHQLQAVSGGSFAISFIGGQHEPSITARAAVLVEANTGTVLFGKNQHEVRELASITKVMTAIVALERGDLADTVTVSRRAAQVPGSSLGLAPGQQLKLEELIRGMMLRSGNDGATAIAEHIGGSVEAFVGLMNARARSMGLRNTRFANPHGLSAPGHYSTAHDIAVMCMRGLAVPKFAQIVGCTELWASQLEGESVKGSTLVYNTNKLLWSYEGADGVKTGTTTAAGHCLAASASRDGLQFISVVLKSSSRFRDSAVLLDYGFNNFKRKDIAEAGEEIACALVDGGATPTVGMATAQTVQVVVRANQEDMLKAVVDCPDKPQAPVRVGQHLGWLRLVQGEEELQAFPLFAMDNVKPKWGF